MIDETQFHGDEASSPALDEAIAAYLEAVEQGEPPDPGRWIAKHPDLADELQEFFANRDRMEALAAPVRRPRMPAVRRFGDYELLEEVAAGGMGVVYKARQRGLNRIVALKMIRAGELAGDDEVRRFREEAETAANLKHPSIVTIHEVGRENGQDFFSMDYIAGKSLAEIVAAGPVLAERAARYARQIAEAVHYAHEQGILHRDLKPSNVLIGSGDAVHITDFGLAKRVDSDSDLTATGQILGTPGYMSPEQAGARHEEVTRASDVYSLGVILYELLTGRPPFRGATPLETLQQTQQHEPVALRMLNPKIPRDLETICLKCLQKPPAARYGSAADVAADIARYESGEPILARPVGRLARLARWCRRRPALAAAWGAGLAAILLLVVVFAALAASAQNYSAYRAAEREREKSDELRGELADSLSEADRQRRRAESARGVEETLRKEKEAALEELELAHRDESNQRLLAENALEKARDLDYFLRIAGADRAWHDNDVEAAEEFLDGCPGDLRKWEWHFLKHLCHTDELTLKLGAAAKTVATSADGRFLASVDAAGEFSLWDADTHRVLLTGEGATSAAFSPTAQQIAVGTTEGSVMVCDAVKQEWIATHSVHSKPVSSISYSPKGDRFASTDEGGNLAVTSPDGGKLWDVTVPGGRPLHAVAWHPDGRQIAAAGGKVAVADFPEETPAVYLLTADTGEVTKRLPHHAAGVPFAVTFACDGTVLVSGHRDHTIRGWNIEEDRAEFVLRGHGGAVRSVAVGPDAGVLLSAGDDQAIRAWNMESGEQVGIYRGHRGPVEHIAVDRSRSQILTASADGTVKAWDAARGRESWIVLQGVPKRHRFIGVDFRPDDQQLAAVSGRSVFFAAPHEFMSLTHRPTNPEIAAAPLDSTVSVDVNDGRKMSLIGRAGSSVAFNPATMNLHVGGGSPLAAFEHESGKRLYVQKERPHGRGSRIALSPDGRLVATKCSDGLGVFDAASGELLKAFPLLGKEAAMIDAAFTPDGEFVAAAINKRWMDEFTAIIVWRIENGEQVARLEGMKAPMTDIDISPDGTLLAAGGGPFVMKRLPPELKVWDLMTGRLVHDLKGHENCVWSVAFSRDGSRLISAGGMWNENFDAGEIKVWDVKYGQHLLDLRGHTMTVMDVAFSHDGRLLASAGEDGTVRVWGDGGRRPASRRRLLEEETGSDMQTKGTEKWVVPARPQHEGRSQ